MANVKPIFPMAGLRRLLHPALFWGVLVVVGGLRWWLRSRHLVDWDAVNYALGLSRFDIVHDQPHMPGYFLYIQIGRLLFPLIRDANETLVLVSALFGLGTVVLLYRVGSEILGPRAGLLAAALGLTGPLFWFQSSVASSRTTEGYFALLVAILCWRVRRDDDRTAFWWLPFLLAATAGVRQQAAPFLIPMVLWATARVPVKRRLIALLLLIVTSLLWVLPLLKAVGGPPIYLERSAAQWDSFVVRDTGVFYATSFSEALARLWGNVGRVALYAFYVAPLGIFAVPLALRRGAIRSDARAFLAVAALPALAFLCLFHIQQIGHAMTFAPWAALAIAAGLRTLPVRLRMPAVALTLAVNVAWLAFGPPRFVGRQLAPTLSALRFNDHYVAALGPLLRTEAPAGESLVIATDSVARLMDFYLPEYRAVTALDRGGGQVAFVRHGSQESEPPAENSLRAPEDARTFVVVGRESDLSLSPDGARLIVRSRRGESGWSLVAPEGGRFRFADRGVVRIALTRSRGAIRLERIDSEVRLHTLYPVPP